MKNVLFTIVFFISVGVTWGQERIKGKLIDSENGSGLANAIIKNSNNKIISYSNNAGVFTVESTGVYSITKAGYQEKLVTISNVSYQIIQLDINPSSLNEIVINASQIPQKLNKAHATIDIITSKDIERGNTINITDVLNKVPGVFMQSGSLNTNKISIRGIGSRNLYGTSKIRAYFQDIPLTSGNGETTMEDFELSSIARFEIIKGAGSSIYGAGLGGTIHLMPKSAYLNENNIQSDVSFGAFGLMKNIINLNHGNKKNSLIAIYSNTESDGFRDNNAYNRKTFTINSNHFLNDKNNLTFLASFVDLKAFIPSSINENDFLNNPKKAAFTWAQSKGYEDSKRGIFGVSWHHDYNNNIKQASSVFSSFRKSYEPRPFDILSENTFGMGIRSRLLGTFNKLNWTLGGELFKDMYQSENFENLYQNFPIGTGSVEGAKFSDFKEDRHYYNLFIEVNYHTSEKTTLSLGLNFNKTSYTIHDRFITNENPDQSGNYQFKGMLSPKLGLSHVFSKNITLYSNISHGFSPPTTNETLLPDGLINTNIKPETGWNFEVGTRTTFLNNRLQGNLALYKMDVRNLLVARRTGNDQFIGVNAGQTMHNGLELVLKYKWISNNVMVLKQHITYTFNDFKFKEFTDDGTDLSGNKLTGVPSNIGNIGIDFDTKLGTYATLNYQYVGQIPITDSNALFTKNYSVTNIKLGYKHTISKNLNLNAYFGLDNLFNKKYASQILINATGFGNTAPRYYYPGNPINYYTGISLSYQL